MSYRHDYAAFGEHVLRADWMVDEMKRRAEKVKDVAEATAPYDASSHDGPHYRDSFHIETTKEGGAHKDRAEGRVVNTDPAAFHIEFGTRDTPRHRTLGRALDAAGQ